MTTPSPANPVPDPRDRSARQRDLTALPLFGQALVAARLARRAVLTMLTGPDRTAALAACGALEAIARTGSGWTDDHAAIAPARAIHPTRHTAAALEAIRWAFDSVGAAQGAWDFPVDAIVAASARRCLDAVCADRRISALQVSIIIAADVDQIAFACSEAHIRTYDPLGDAVFARLAPCHPLTLTEPTRASPTEEDCR